MEDYQSIYSKNVNSIITDYSELVEHTSNSLFPWWEIKAVEAPILNGMNKWQSVFADIFAPYILLHKPSINRTSKITAYSLWFLVGIFWWVITNGLLESNFTAPNESSAEPVLWIQILAVVLFFIPPIIIYGHTIWFFLTKRVTRKVKLLWLNSLIITLCFIFIQAIKIEELNTDLIVNSEVYFEFLFLIFTPLVIFISFNLLYLGKFFIELMVNTFNSFAISHAAIPQNTIRKALTTSVKSISQEWQISDLETVKISAIKELAINNLEATEKKTIPVVIILASIGLLTALPFFQQLFEKTIQVLLNHIVEVFIPGKSSVISFAQYTSTLAVVILAVIIFSTYLNLFRNLIVQGLLIQICTIAEYAKKTSEVAISETKGFKENQDNFFSLILSKIISLFKR